MKEKEKLIVNVVELKGDAYQIGITQGKEIIGRPQFTGQLIELTKMTEHVDAVKSKGLLQRMSPNLLRELEGMAEASGMDFDSVIQLYSGYDLAFPQMGCTALVQNGYYIRNYDFSPDMYDGRLVFSQPKDGYCSVGFSQHVIGRLDGMNEKGLVVGLHFVNDEHREEGFLSTTIVRMLLDQCANVKEALDMIAMIPHGYCYNFSMSDPSGMNVVVEASPQRIVTRQMDQLICTNHFVSETIRKMNKKTIEDSKKRMEYVGLMNKSMTPLSAYHQFNDENSPLFYHHYKEYFGTLHTVVYSPESLKMIIGVGANCTPIQFSLKEYMEGSLKLPETLEGYIYCQ